MREVSSVLFFPHPCRGKLFRALLTLALAAFLFPIPMARAQTPHRVLIPRATHVDLSHLGVHTHLNFLLFDTGTLDLTQGDNGPHVSGLKIVGHSRLSTDHAALPPEYAALAEGDAPLANPYGPIQGDGRRPGWGGVPLRRNGHNFVKISVPTRFANWVALQSKAKQTQYRDPRNYSLEVRWVEGL